MTLPSEKQGRRCSRCGEVGHRADKCPAGGSLRDAARSIPARELKAAPAPRPASPNAHEIELTVKLNVVVSVQVETVTKEPQRALLYHRHKL